MTDSTQYTIEELLEKHTVTIPAIQRDYAFGRKEEEEKRKAFVKALKDGMEAVLHLDFVYGKTENGVLTLLDGQQRVTTLWLLGVYLGMEQNLLKKFSYDTRTSSREFCKYLRENFQDIIAKDNITEIEKESWFFNSWKYDPTIMGMVEMLGEFHRQGLSGFKSENLKKITFSFLDIESLGEPEELYLKMNSRGKQLSEWENFKAELFELDGIRDEFKKLVDTELVDIFWEINKENRAENTEKSILKLFRNAIRVEVILNAKTVSEVNTDVKISQLYDENWKERVNLEGIEKFWKFIKEHKNLKVEFSRFENGRLRMDYLIDSLQGSEKFEMIASDLALFATYYLFSQYREYKEDDLKHTIRIISNYLDAAPSLDYSYISRYIRNIEEVIKGKEEILESASKLLKDNDEEKEKAKLILLRNGWEDLLYKTERETLSSGTAKWLLDISEGDLDIAQKYYEATFNEIFIGNNIASPEVLSDLWSYSTNLVNSKDQLPMGSTAHDPEKYSWWKFFHDNKAIVVIKEYVDNGKKGNYTSLGTNVTCLWIEQAPEILNKWGTFRYWENVHFMREKHKTGNSKKWQLQLQVLYYKLKEEGIDLEVIPNDTWWKEYVTHAVGCKITYKENHFHIFEEQEEQEEIFVDTGENVTEKLEQTISKIKELATKKGA